MLPESVVRDSNWQLHTLDRAWEDLRAFRSAITSSSDTEFVRFVKAINAADWVRQGHTLFRYRWQVPILPAQTTG